MGKTYDVSDCVRTKVEKYLTENIEHNNCRRTSNFVQMIERTSDHDEENEQPEEAGDLNIPAAELVDCYEGDCTANDGSYRNNHQTLPDVVDEKGVDIAGWGT